MEYLKNLKSTDGDELFNIEDYIESTTRLARDKSSLVFTSSNPVNAAIVMGNILRFSEREVRIYEDSICGDIADTTDFFLKNLDRFLQEQKHIKIVVRNFSENESEIFKALTHYSEKYHENVELRLASEEFKQNIQDSVDKDVNFIVNDVFGYRADIFAKNEPESRIAFSSFNDQIMSEKLIRIFDEKYHTCESVPLPAHA